MPASTAATPAYPTYPTREEDVTALALIRHMVNSAQQAAYRCQDFVGRTDSEGMARYFAASAVLVDGFAVAALLRSISISDPAKADEAAVWLWSAWESGDLIHELLWEWCREYGIPTEADPSGQPGGAA